MTHKHSHIMPRQAGLTMVELMVALAIGSFLIIGAVQIYNQSRQAFVVNESIARVQETAHFAMDTSRSATTAPAATAGHSILPARSMAPITATDCRARPKAVPTRCPTS